MFKLVLMSSFRVWSPNVQPLTLLKNLTSLACSRRFSDCVSAHVSMLRIKTDAAMTYCLVQDVFLHTRAETHATYHPYHHHARILHHIREKKNAVPNQAFSDTFSNWIFTHWRPSWTPSFYTKSKNYKVYTNNSFSFFWMTISLVIRKQ